MMKVSPYLSLIDWSCSSYLHRATRLQSLKSSPSLPRTVSPQLLLVPRMYGAYDSSRRTTIVFLVLSRVRSRFPSCSLLSQAAGSRARYRVMLLLVIPKTPHAEYGMTHGVRRWWLNGSDSFPATNECGESFTAMCLKPRPNEMRAQSADATETETSGPKLSTRGSRLCCLSKLAFSWRSRSSPFRSPT